MFTFGRPYRYAWLTDEVNKMEWYRRFSKSLLSALETWGRARALAELRMMDPEFLRRNGFSPALLRQGVGAWPWRVESEESKRAALLEVSPGTVAEGDERPAAPVPCDDPTHDARIAA